MDADFAFAVVEAVEPSDVLGDGAAPGDGHGEKKGFEPGVVEAFADESPGGEDDAGGGCGEVAKLGEGVVELLFAEAAAELDDGNASGAEAGGEDVEVRGPFGENEGDAALGESLRDIGVDEGVAGFVVNEGVAEALELDAGVVGGVVQRAERGGADDDVVGEGAGVGLLPGFNAVTDGSALHEDDGVVAVLAGDGGGQAGDVSRLGAAGDEFETAGGEVVAFVDDEVAVVGDAVVHGAFANEALDEGDVEGAGEFAASAAQATNGFCGQVEEGGEAFEPLLHELLAVNKDEGIHSAPGDEPGGEDGLAEGGRGGEDAGVVGEHGEGGGLLLGAEGGGEADIELGAGLAFVPHLEANVKFPEEGLEVFQTAAWKGDVRGIVFGAGDDAGFVVGGQAHGLGAVEFGILKCGEADEAVAEGGRKIGFRDVDLVGENDVEGGRDGPGDGGLGGAAGGGHGPGGEGEVFVGREAHGEDAVFSFGLGDEVVDLRASDFWEAGEVRPLVGVGTEVVIEEEGVTVFAGGFLEGEGDEVAETAAGEGCPDSGRSGRRRRGRGRGGGRGFP